MSQQTSNSGLNDKQLVANHAASLIEEGMIVGLGTGSTANYFIEQLARRKQDENLNFTVVASSVVSTIKAQQLGLDLIAIEHLKNLDIYVDGADEVAPDMTLLKGRGFDLVREKLLARACDQFYVLIDNSKLVSRIGENFPIPMEVTPFAWQLVLQTVQKLGGEGGLRQNTAGDGLAITSHGSLVLDMRFGTSMDSHRLNKELNAVPGLIEHGIFDRLASQVFLAQQGVVQTIC